MDKAFKITPTKEAIVASKKYCWWDWSEQLNSIKKLLNLDVSWLLPGHGYAHKFDSGEWKTLLKNTLDYCKKKSID